MTALSRLAGEARAFYQAWLRGCAQLAFCDSPAAGMLVVFGITLASPMAGAGTLLGALFGTVVGRLTSAYPREEWAWGLAGFNPAIIGLLSGGFLAGGEVHAGVLGAALALSMLLDVVFRRVLDRFMLPALSLAALTTLYLVSWLAAPAGGWFWTDAPVNALFPFGVAGAALVLAAMVVRSPFAGIWAILLSAVAFLSGWLLDHDPRSLVGLWGITVPLASFGVHAIFMRGSLVGRVAGSVAASLGALVWIAWEASPLGQWLPPLVLPFIVGVWLSMLLMRRVMTLPFAQAGYWRIVRMIADARASGADVVALIPRDSAADVPLSSFMSGVWLDPELPRAAFEPDSLRDSPRCRRVLWEASSRLRDEAKQVRPGPLWTRLARLKTRGWIQSVVIQDALIPAEIARSHEVVAIHGDTARTRCLGCGAEGIWPPTAVWRRCDLRCGSCQGAVVPFITLFGGDLDATTSSRLQALQGRCAVALVLGDEASEPATREFLDRVREAGAAVAFVSDAKPSYPRRGSDVSVRERPERFLAHLCDALGAWHLLSRLRAQPGKRASDLAGARKQSREATG
jgi:urea transporter/NAD-dependent SIR2 family protein deacetylase